MYLSKRHRRGLLWLLLLGVAISFTPRLLASLLQPKVEISYTTFLKAQSELKEVSGDKQEPDQKKSSDKKKKRAYRTPVSKFDPNLYQVSDWMKLGLSEKQANVVVNFAKRGIKNNNDLSRIFVIDSELFDLIKDSTTYPNPINKVSVPEKKIVFVDLNSASMEELMSVSGIGEFYAKKIIERRGKLGGFVRKEQLLELWKFDEEKFNKVKDQVIVKGEPKRININAADIDELKSHPYLSYTEANAIVKYRSQHGLYKSIEEIKQSDWIDEMVFEKIEPYLTISND